jgi:hypothetical protein
MGITHRPFDDAYINWRKFLNIGYGSSGKFYSISQVNKRLI